MVAMRSKDEDEAADGTSETQVDDQPAPESAGEASRTDGLETLRERYVRGELTHEEFERKFEALLETDSQEHATDHL